MLNEIRNIKDINTELGLYRASNDENLYLKMLEMFSNELPDKYTKLEDSLHNKDIEGFRITVHSLKSMLGTIGAMAASEKAKELETAAREEDINFCMENFPAFLTILQKLDADLKPIFPNKIEDSKKEKGDPAHLMVCAGKAMEEIEKYNLSACEEAMSDMFAYDFGDAVNGVLEELRNALDEYEYNTGTECLRKLMEIINVL